MPVELGEHLGTHDLVGGAARRPTLGQVDDPVHDGQQGVHLVRGQEDGHLVVAGHPVEQRHDLLDALGVEIGQGLVEQEELRAADQGMGDQDPLLLPPREGPDAGVGKALGVDVTEHLVDQLTLGLGAPPEAVALRVETERDQVARPDRDVGVEQHLLGHIPERAVRRPTTTRPRTRTWPLSGRCSPRMTRRSVVLPTPLEPMSPVNSPLRISKETPSSTVRPEKETPMSSTSRTGAIHHRCSVEVLCTTAALIAATSANIQDW